ncbi:MAG: UDP-N-acetylenolpyruvoylglucosamine reductase [Acidimicrobiales bacterium]|nr:MAG: UDP-N-acetylmuramate dehydrogenase [Actinomycetota bacterium]MBV6508749.1 UDP-N-acetylenolpyruvoylglucosamine reductase [Acidimicrobiales bacterium]RIK06514.1 MAG: UDP-N-acetylenolpyruvoylglucosamine reductase [Acidobacteriota bacterium]
MTWDEVLRRRLDLMAECFPALRRDVDIAAMTTYRVGGAAAGFLEVADEDELARIVDFLVSEPIAVLLIGNGSNLLVADAGFAGLALHLSEAFGEVVIDGTVVRAGAAAPLPVVARRTALAGLTGFEWAVGVPGTVGGAVRMNAGGHGSDIARCLLRVRVVDLHSGEDEVVPASGLDLRYRHSNLRSEQLVVCADLGLRNGDPSQSLEAIAGIVKWRRENQPGGQNAGSVFANPEGDSAGRLIDAAGCKGLRIGSAEVSPKHANFFQADEGGSADDIYRLMSEVRRRVLEQTGTSLEAETRLVGFDGEDRR